MISRLVSVSELTLHRLIPWDAEPFKPHSWYRSSISCSCFRGSLPYPAARIPPNPGFANLGTVDTSVWTILCCSHCPVHFKVFSSIPGPYPPDVSSTSQVVAIKNVSRCCQTSLERSPHCWEPVNPSVPRRKLCQELTWICAVWIYVIIIYGGCTATEQRIYIKATTGVLSEKNFSNIEGH